MTKKQPMPTCASGQIVSFDLFDTLVCRDVMRPIDVFKIVEREAISQGLAAEGFASDRRAAELEALRELRDATGLADIYERLPARYTGDLRETLTGLELAVELRVCRPRRDGMELYERVVSSGARVIVTSDMYLPSSFLSKLLASCGYDQIERIFVSCEHAATKAGRSLYGVVAQELGVSPADILHIGDNPKSDVLAAKRAGVKAKYLPLPDRADRERFRGDLDESIVSGLQADYSQALPTGATDGIEGSLVYGVLDELGYKGLGPVVTGFVTWLSKRCQRDGIERLYFLSRDGLIVMRTAEAMSAKLPEYSYLYASRSALTLPALCVWDDLEKISTSIAIGWRLTIVDFFKYLGLDRGEVTKRLTAAGIDCGAAVNVDEPHKDPLVIKAYGILHDWMMEKSRAEYDLLVSYLRQEGFSGRVGVADIGWFGHMQLALQSVADDAGLDAEVYGYYVGLQLDKRHGRTAERKVAYLFDRSRPDDAFGVGLERREILYNSLLESLFLAAHGTTLGYERQNGKVIPVLGERSEAEVSMGETMERVRLGSLAFAKDWARVVGEADVQIRPEVALATLDRMVNHPSQELVEVLGDLGFEDAGVVRPVAAPQPKRVYLAHPRELYVDYRNTTWKAGFLRRLTGLPLDYATIINHVKDVVGYDR